MKLRGETPEEDIELGLTTGAMAKQYLMARWRRD